VFNVYISHRFEVSVSRTVIPASTDS